MELHVKVSRPAVSQCDGFRKKRFIGNSIEITSFNGFSCESSSGDDIDIKKTNLMAPFLDGVQLPQGYSHFEEAVYFLPLSSQKFPVLILLTLKG